MNKIDAERDSDDDEEGNNSDMGELDENDGITMEEDDGEESKK